MRSYLFSPPLGAQILSKVQNQKKIFSLNFRTLGIFTALILSALKQTSAHGTHTHLHYRDGDEWHSRKVIVSLMTLRRTAARLKLKHWPGYVAVRRMGCCPLPSYPHNSLQIWTLQTNYHWNMVATDSNINRRPQMVWFTIRFPLDRPNSLTLRKEWIIAITWF